MAMDQGCSYMISLSHPHAPSPTRLNSRISINTTYGVILPCSQPGHSPELTRNTITNHIFRSTIYLLRPRLTLVPVPPATRTIHSTYKGPPFQHSSTATCAVSCGAGLSYKTRRADAKPHGLMPAHRNDKEISYVFTSPIILVIHPCRTGSRRRCSRS